MKIFLLVIVISISSLSIYSQKKESKFETQVLQYFKQGYLISKENQLSKPSLEEFDYPAVFFKDVLQVDKYILKSKNEIHGQINYFHFILYSYKNTETSNLVMNQVDSINKKSFEEREYGPFSKDYHLFFTGDKHVIQFIGFCNVSQENWGKIVHELLNIAKNNFGKMGKELNKQCGL